MNNIIMDDLDMLNELDRVRRAWCELPRAVRLRIATDCRDAVDALGKRTPATNSETELRCALEMIAGRCRHFEDPECKDPVGVARDTLDDWDNWRLG